MFINEITPLLKEVTKEPIAFFGGFFSGLLRLNLSDDPVKSWLDQQGASSAYTAPTSEDNNTKNNGPQSISID